MPATYKKIASATVTGSNTASIEFTSISADYTDLKLVVSGRGTRSFEVDDLVIQFNSSTTGYSGRRLLGGGGAPGSSPSSDTLTDIRGAVPGASCTADVFGSTEFYIPNYTSSNNKSVSVDAVGENNAVASYNWFVAGLWSNSAAITSIKLFANNGNIVVNSTATLYGIKRY
jgi:hypothetical protein